MIEGKLVGGRRELKGRSSRELVGGRRREVIRGRREMLEGEEEKG